MDESLSVPKSPGYPPLTNPLQSWRVLRPRAVSGLIPWLTSNPTSRILQLEWYECWPATEHNFVALQVGIAEDKNLWLRIDRIGMTDQFHISDFKNLMIDVDALDHHRYRTLVTAFKHPPPLHKLGVLLSVLLSEFLHLPHLLLLSDDSYFYCLAIYENLVELGEGEYIARAPRQFAHEAREWVKMRMQTSQNRSSRPSSSLPNLQHGPIPLSTDALSGLVEAPDLTGRIFRLDSSAFATGGYSSVWRGSLPSATPNDPNGSLRVVIKVLRASHTNELTAEWKLHKRLHREMRIWTRLRHDNVVRLLGHSQEPEGPGLVSMLYPHGNVLSFLAKNPSVNREVICADVALGLQYLHEHDPPIIHGDLKGLNVLIDGEGRASLCGFGLSIILDGEPTGHTSSNNQGSLRFLAPELQKEGTRTVETDIYAYACTCIPILFDREPYHQLRSDGQVMFAIFTHQPPFEPSTEEVTFPSVLQNLQHCWDRDPSNRPLLKLIIETIQRCLHLTHQANLGVHQGIGRRVRLRCLPGMEQANLISVAAGGLSILVDSGAYLHWVPIYQRYHWEFMDGQNLQVSADSVPSWFFEVPSQTGEIILRNFASPTHQWCTTRPTTRRLRQRHDRCQDENRYQNY